MLTYINILCAISFNVGSSYMLLLYHFRLVANYIIINNNNIVCVRARANIIIL